MLKSGCKVGSFAYKSATRLKRAIKLENTIDRRHIVRGRNSFAFSDVRHIIAKAALSERFDRVCVEKANPHVNQW